MLFNLIQGIRISLVGFLFLFPAFLSASAAENHTFEAQVGELMGGATKVVGGASSGGSLVGLAQPGQGVKFTGLPAAGKLAIRYASVTNGTISVSVNDQPVRKVNVHCSGGAHQSRSALDH